MKPFERILGLACLLLLPACGGASGSGPHGTWTLDTSAIVEQLEKSQAEALKQAGPAAEMVKSMMAPMIEGFKKMKTTLQIQPGGKANMKGIDESGEAYDDQGTWTLSGDTLTLTMTEQGKTEQVITLTLSGNTLAAPMDDAEEPELGMPVPNMVFRRR